MKLSSPQNIKQILWFQYIMAILYNDLNHDKHLTNL